MLSEDNVLREKLNLMAFKNKKPDLTFLLDIDVKIAETRLNLRGKSFLDEKPLDFFKVMRTSFLEIAEKEKWIVLNGSNSIESVFFQIKKQVDKYLIAKAVS